MLRSDARPALTLVLSSGPRLSDMRLRSSQADLRLGGPEGNSILTSAAAGVLTVFLLAEGVTIIDLGGLRPEHMFIGLVLIPPVLLKLASTGYRFLRYYTGSPHYRRRGPPVLPLRVLGPLLVGATVVVLATGVWLMLVGHKSQTLFTVHKASFIAWGVIFGIHFLAHLPRMTRSLRNDWRASRRRSVPGSSLRAMVVASSLGAGLALAFIALSLIAHWHAGGG